MRIDMDGAVPVTGTRRFSHAQPIWQLVLLSTFTFGLYEIYWFYRNWKQLRDEDNLDVNPLGATAFIAVGYLMIIWLGLGPSLLAGTLRPVAIGLGVAAQSLVHRHFCHIRDAATRVGSKQPLTPWVLTAAWILFNIGGWLPDPLGYVSFGSVIPLAIAHWAAPKRRGGLWKKRWC
jgi:fatty acid desaturase